MRNSELRKGVQPSAPQNAELAIVVLLFIVLASLYSFVVPLGEGPDEPGHAAYAFFLAREGRLPVQHSDRRQSDVPGEGHQPPLAYTLASLMLAWLPPQERQIDLPGNPRFTWAGGDELNAVAHGSREYWPWRSAVLAWHLARLVSVALGAVTVLCTYMAAQAIDQRLHPAIEGWTPARVRPKMPLLAAAFVALNPQFLFISGLITNDALLTTLSAAMLWLIVRDGRRSAATRSSTQARMLGERWRAAALGLLLGLALLTKQSALILTPIALLGAMERRMEGSDRTGSAARQGVAYRACPPSLCHFVTVPSWLIVPGTAVLVSGWWYARNVHLYGDPFGLAAFRAEFATQRFEVGNLAAWSAALGQLYASFWGRFGWMNVPAPAWAIWALAALNALGVAGLVLALIAARRREPDRRRWAVVGHWALVALPALTFVWVVGFAITAGLVAWQGRLLFPALPAIAILLARGLTAWENREQRTENNVRSHVVLYSLFFVLCSLFLLSLWLPFGVIRPAYPFHTLPEARALERIGTPVYGRLGVAGEPGAELRGWRLEGVPRPGGTLEVVLIWHALARQNRDWVVFVHLVDPNDRIVAEDNREPQDGAFPMTQWVAGDWVEDRHPLPLPPDLVPGTYTLRIGLYDPRARGERAGVYDRRGKLSGDYLDVGNVHVGL